MLSHRQRLSFSLGTPCYYQLTSPVHCLMTQSFYATRSCQLREKVLAEAATSFIIVADSRKDSKILGTNWKQGVPIEVAPFAWATVFQSTSSFPDFVAFSRTFRSQVDTVAALEHALSSVEILS